jgi:hypothetical protein
VHETGTMMQRSTPPPSMVASTCSIVNCGPCGGEAPSTQGRWGVLGYQAWIWASVIFMGSLMMGVEGRKFDFILKKIMRELIQFS